MGVCILPFALDWDPKRGFYLAAVILVAISSPRTAHFDFVVVNAPSAKEAYYQWLARDQK